MTNNFKQVIIWIFGLLILTVVFFACSKNFKENIDNTFTQNEAKEWYYGTFKKSAEFKQSKDWGKKLPYWKKGSYRKVGNMEIVEFPLNKKQKSFAIPSAANLSGNEVRKIADGSLSRIALIKTPEGNIVVREIDYIPDIDFLQSKGYDISDIQLGAKDNTFSGRIITKKWDGTVLSTRKLENGRITSTGKRISNVERNQKRNSLSASTAATLSDCQIYEICLYERYCEEVLMGDNWTPTGNCTPWEPTGYCFYEEYCGTGQCDYGSSQSCECQLYGIGCDSGGGGGGSGGDSECLNNCTSAFNALYTGSQVVAETISFDISTISDFTKYKNPKWRILKNLTWSLYSQEYGVVRLVDSQTNKWQWESLVHGPITKEGFTPGGTVTFTQGVGTPTFTPGTQNILYAGMSLNFDVTYSPICDCLGVSNIIPSVTVNYTANALWEAKP